jgi:hypothetical protein
VLLVNTNDPVAVHLPAANCLSQFQLKIGQEFFPVQNHPFRLILNMQTILAELKAPILEPPERVGKSYIRSGLLPFFYHIIGNSVALI